MSKALAEKSRSAWEVSPVKPLDEAVWRAWKASGGAQDKKDLQIPMKTLPWSLVVALLTVTGFWSHLAAYDIVIQCLAAAAAIDLMTYAIHNRHYWIAPVFTRLAILYYPVRPLTDFCRQLAADAGVAECRPAYRISRPARSEGGPR